MKTKKHIFAILIFILIIVGILAGYFRSFQNTQSIDDQKMYTLDEYQEKFDHSKWKDLQKNRPIPGRFFNSKIGGGYPILNTTALVFTEIPFSKRKAGSLINSSKGKIYIHNHVDLERVRMILRCQVKNVQIRW